MACDLPLPQNALRLVRRPEFERPLHALDDQTEITFLRLMRQNSATVLVKVDHAQRRLLIRSRLEVFELSVFQNEETRLPAAEPTRRVLLHDALFFLRLHYHRRVLALLMRHPRS